MTAMLVKIGMVSIAVGAVSGYALALVVERSPIFKRIGIRHPARIRQVHLDWIIMGTVLVATGLAAPNLPVWVVVLVALGGIVNPLLFLPLAFRASAQQNLVYRVASGISFTALSTGLVSTAIVVCSR
jgi:hydroxylaminobenzene mutase